MDESPSGSDAKGIGVAGEEAVASFIAQRGHTIICRNYRKKFGEIDIVSTSDGVMHFIEVKTSKFFHDSGFLPEVRVDSRKARKLRNICRFYLSENKVQDNTPWQIDVASVMLDDSMAPKGIELFENAVFDRI